MAWWRGGRTSWYSILMVMLLEGNGRDPSRFEALFINHSSVASALCFVCFAVNPNKASMWNEIVTR
jgi:hypothetical protein